MVKRHLAIVERAFRGSLEEQYGHILWLATSLCKMKTEIDVILKGNAVLYAVKVQHRRHLDIGRLQIDQLPDYLQSITDMKASGMTLYVMLPDCHRLGIAIEELIPGVQPINEEGFVACLESYDLPWFW
jgi:hypothetical protein